MDDAGSKPKSSYTNVKVSTQAIPKPSNSEDVRLKYAQNFVRESIRDACLKT